MLALTMARAMDRPFPARLECSACGETFTMDRLRNLCEKCRGPLLVRYEIHSSPQLRAIVQQRAPNMWRYFEVLPVSSPDEIITLGEGATPMLPAQVLGESLGTPGLFIKDESKNPTRSFKSRGMSAAVTMARSLGASSFAAPTAGNAGCALAAYGARASTPVFVAMPDDTPPSIVDECRSYGATVELVRGVITDAARRVQQHVAEHGGFDVSTLKEPYRVEGKKTMGYELLEDLKRLPDVILYPTGGGTGLIGMWKAFEEMEQLGWIGSERPRMIVVQSEGCAPVVRAVEQGLDHAPEWEHPRTSAWGLRVPRALGDRLMLAAIRESNGSAIAVPEKEIEPAAAELRSLEGIDAGPETGAALVALRMMLRDRTVDPDAMIVIFNTGGNKYR